LKETGVDMDAEATNTDTIFALSSGRGRAGVAVVRVSGPQARDCLKALAGSVPPPRQAVLRALADPGTGETLDKALVLFFEAPASFTGEDVAEFHVHGGPSVTEGVGAALAALPGLRPAEAGDFARRAFENGKLDLTEVEGLADLIDAETRAQRLQALRQSGGALRALYEGWREKLIDALALVEAALDFSDEADVPVAVEKHARPVVEGLAAEIAAHLDDARAGERLRQGFTVVLAGAPNAGKSSLLNALAARDVAIVSEQPGTTRDVLEVHLDLQGLPVTILDTAGIRAAEGAIEEEGIRRALARAETADLVIWLVDAGDPHWQPPSDVKAGSAPVLTVLNKIDLAEPVPPEAMAGDVTRISAKTGVGLEALTALLGKRVSAGLEASEAPVITRARHRRELEMAREALDAFLAGDASALELRAEELRTAAHALGRITGRVDVEDVLDRIFAGFCIGK
jgi:tRNA modification GTPase